MAAGETPGLLPPDSGLSQAELSRASHTNTAALVDRHKRKFAQAFIRGVSQQGTAPTDSIPSQPDAIFPAP